MQNACNIIIQRRGGKEQKLKKQERQGGERKGKMARKDGREEWLK